MRSAIIDVFSGFGFDVMEASYEAPLIQPLPPWIVMMAPTSDTEISFGPILTTGPYLASRSSREASSDVVQ